MSAGCMSSQADVIKKNLEAEVEAQGLEDEVEVRRRRLHGLLRRRARWSAWTRMAGTVFVNLSSRKTRRPLSAALKGGTCDVQRGDPNHPFFAKQMHIVRANGGIVDPERIEDYIAVGGYQALHHVLTEMNRRRSSRK